MPPVHEYYGEKRLGGDRAVFRPGINGASWFPKQPFPVASNIRGC